MATRNTRESKSERKLKSLPLPVLFVAKLKGPHIRGLYKESQLEGFLRSNR